MDNKPKKNVKKPKKRAPRRRQIKKDKSVKQNVNVTVSSGGGSGGSGGAAIPSQPQQQFNPFLQSAMQARKEENSNLINQLQELKNKQDKGNQLLRDIQRRPDDMAIKEDIKQVLQDEQQMESNIIDDITAQEEMPALSSMETPSKTLTPYQRKKERKAERDSIITAIQELGGIVPSNIKTKGLKDYLDELLQIERDVNNEGKDKEI
jgi:hypothetical protein